MYPSPPKNLFIGNNHGTESHITCHKGNFAEKNQLNWRSAKSCPAKVTKHSHLDQKLNSSEQKNIRKVVGKVSSCCSCFFTLFVTLVKIEV